MVGILAVYGGLHLASTAYYALSNRHAPSPGPAREAFTPRMQVLASALTRMLAEDGVADAHRWASAIVAACPTTDPGYIALVTAQIRRESRFLSADLEWIFHRTVPELAHELGVPDPIRTIGPMQVQRWRLEQVFERTLGTDLGPHEVKELAYGLEAGVAAAVAVLDPIVTDYFPDRRLTGWAHQVGTPGITGDNTTARSRMGSLGSERHEVALLQKILSDLTGHPLALDGVIGERTREVAFLIESRLPPPERSAYRSAVTAELQPDAVFEIRASSCWSTLRELWTEAFNAPLPQGIPPRITHDPRLGFVLADFNSGRGASRIAALQFMLNDLLELDLAVDGKMGPETREAMLNFYATFEPDHERRSEFLELVRTGTKPLWVRDQTLRRARDLWRARHGEEPPDALVPDLWHDGFAQQIKGLGRISVEGYVSGSAAFFEEYLLRLLAFTGEDWTEGRVRPPSFR